MQMSAVVKQANNGVKSNKAFCPDIDIVDMDKFRPTIYQEFEKAIHGKYDIFFTTMAHGQPKKLSEQFYSALTKTPFPQRNEMLYYQIKDTVLPKYKGLVVYPSGNSDTLRDLWDISHSWGPVLFVSSMPNSIIVTSAYSKKEMDPKVFYIKGAIAAYYDVNNSNNLFQPFKQSDNYQAWENIVKQLNDFGRGVGGTCTSAALVTQFAGRILTKCPGLSAIEVKSLLYYHTIPHALDDIRFFGIEQQKELANLLNGPSIALLSCRPDEYYGCRGNYSEDNIQPSIETHRSNSLYCS